MMSEDDQSYLKFPAHMSCLSLMRDLKISSTIHNFLGLWMAENEEKKFFKSHQGSQTHLGFIDLLQRKAITPSKEIIIIIIFIKF